jgi:UDP-glucuronate 4-epimerase
MKKPLLFEDVNVRGTISVLEAIHKAGINKLVFASSSSVYGDARRIPFREDDEGNAKRSPPIGIGPLLDIPSLFLGIMTLSF